VAVAGFVLILVGFALVVPGGAISGSASIRNVEVPGSHVERTPGYQSGTRAPAGYQESPVERTRWIRLALGVAMPVAGFALIAIAV
jgi:hypothetical protein